MGPTEAHARCVRFASPCALPTARFPLNGLARCIWPPEAHGAHALRRGHRSRTLTLWTPTVHGTCKPPQRPLLPVHRMTRLKGCGPRRVAPVDHGSWRCGAQRRRRPERLLTQDRGDGGACRAHHSSETRVAREEDCQSAHGRRKRSQRSGGARPPPRVQWSYEHRSGHRRGALGRTVGLARAGSVEPSGAGPSQPQ